MTESLKQMAKKAVAGTKGLSGDYRDQMSEEEKAFFRSREEHSQTTGVRSTEAEWQLRVGKGPSGSTVRSNQRH